jgi:hypothetical protein
MPQVLGDPPKSPFLRGTLNPIPPSVYVKDLCVHSSLPGRGAGEEGKPLQFEDTEFQKWV